MRIEKQEYFDPPSETGWTYRLVRVDEETVLLAEVYFSDWKWDGYTGTEVMGGSSEEVRLELSRMMDATWKGILPAEVFEHGRRGLDLQRRGSMQ